MKMIIFDTRKILVLIITLTLFIQCKKELRETVEVVEPGSVIISVSGLDNLEDNIGKLGSKVPFLNNDFELSRDLIKSNKEIELTTHAFILPLDYILDSKGTEESVLEKKSSLTSALEEDKLYRIIFKSTSGPEEYDFIRSANDTFVAKLEKNTTYNWYAYSYNDNSASDFEILTSEFNVKTLPDKDLLFAKGTISTTNSTTVPTKITISFEHKVAKMSFNVDANALLGDLESFEAELIEIGGITDLNTVFKTGKLDLNTGTVTNDPSSSVNVSKDLNYIISANKKTAEAPSFFTTALTNINSVKILVTGATRKKNGSVESILSSGLEAELTFNFPTATAYGKNHISRIVLKSIFPQMTIMHTDSNYARYGFTPMNHLFLATYEGVLGTRPSGPGGFLMTHFVPEGVNPNYRQYFPNKIKMEATHVHLNAFNNAADGNLYKYGAQKIVDRLTNTPKPDIVFLSNYLLYPSTADINALIDYVEDGGVVIVTADRGMAQGSAGNAKWVWRDQRLIDFFRAVFPAAPGKTVEVNQYQSTDLTFPLDKFEFKINSSINDQITNGYFGDVRKNYWGSYRHITYLTGIDPNAIVSYSSAVPRTGYDGAGSIPADAQIMIRSKEYNVIFIGNTYFPSDYVVDAPVAGTQGLINDAVAYANINYAAGNNGYALNATPITSTARGVKTDNSKLYANMILWAMSVVRERGE